MNEHAERIKRLFGGEGFKFARWGGAISPAVFGLDEPGQKLFHGAVEMVADLAGAKIEELDPEMGANFLIYVVQDWNDASRAPNLPNFLPNLPDLIARLNEANANRYRVFAFDDQNAIRAAITLLRYDEQMQKAPVDYIALTEAALGMLVYDEAGVSEDRPVVMAKFEGDEPARALVSPWHAELIKAAYDPAIPAGSNDPSLALRLAARIGLAEATEEEDEDDASD